MTRIRYVSSKADHRATRCHLPSIPQKKTEQKILTKKHGFEVSRKNKLRVNENKMSFKTPGKQKHSF